MPTLGTQTISSSYAQLIKTFGTGGLDGSLQVITDGDNTSSALLLSTSGVQSTGSFTVSSNSSLFGPVTFGTSLTASTGTATIGTLSVGTQSVGTSTIGISTVSTLTVSTANIPLQLGNVTFGSNITASTGTATIGTLSNSTATIGTATISTATISTATISTATIPLQLGNITFGSNITASTGTATLGTINSNFTTIGTTKFGTSGPSLIAVTYTTATYSGGTLQDIDHVTGGSNSSTGTFSATGVAIGDIVLGSINSIGSTTGITASRLFQDFRVESANIIRFTILNTDQTAGTIPAGIVSATAMRFTA